MPRCFGEANLLVGCEDVSLRGKQIVVLLSLLLYWVIVCAHRNDNVERMASQWNDVPAVGGHLCMPNVNCHEFLAHSTAQLAGQQACSPDSLQAMPQQRGLSYEKRQGVRTLKKAVKVATEEAATSNQKICILKNDVKELNSALKHVANDLMEETCLRAEAEQETEKIKKGRDVVLEKHQGMWKRVYDKCNQAGLTKHDHGPGSCYP